MSESPARFRLRNAQAIEFARNMVQWHRGGRVKTPLRSPLTGIELSQERTTPARLSWALAKAFSLYDYSQTLLYAYDIVDPSENFMTAGDQYHWSLLVPKEQQSWCNSEVVFQGWQMRPLRAAIHAAMWFQWRIILLPRTPLAVVHIDEDWRVHVGTSHNDSQALIDEFKELVHSPLTEKQNDGVAGTLLQLSQDLGE